MGSTATPTRQNCTITVDFHDETTYFELLSNAKAFVEFVLAFVLSLGFQLLHKSSCSKGGSLTRHSHYACLRLRGLNLACPVHDMPSSSLYCIVSSVPTCGAPP